jgi:integrase
MSEALGDWTAHTLRHRCATDAYAASHDIMAVRSILGHAKVETTMVYVALADEAMREALKWAA